ncbi:hypothetical protein ACFPIK_00400 [Algoriphagus aquatilis]|uniref:Uncharacterized protein n=1 Tax=Algoriphagus aquatilis TaxID=490186 RepID=A0ABW0BRF5_9BACT
MMKSNFFHKPHLSPIWTVLLLGIILFSCKENEKPSVPQTKITITGIELISGTVPNGRANASVSWNHLFPSDFQVTFKNTQDGKSYDLRINPNDFSKSYSIELPAGSYSYQGNPSNTNPISSELPITVTGEVQVGASAVNLKLKGYSTYGLLTFSKRNVPTPPLLANGTSSPLVEKSGFYYVYHKETSLKVDVPLAGGKKIRLPVTNSAFSHAQFQFRATGDTDPDQFITKHFSLNQRSFTLSPEGFPTELVPYLPVDLPQSQRETSGLAWVQGKLFSINDGGNAAEIYELNPQTGALLRTITVEGVSNIDWEDLAVSQTHVFVGDFGNNLGNRKDLRILKISIADLISQTKVQPQLIEFSFSDQSQFSFTANSHNFDCEAMVFANGKIHLFSKNWTDSKTKHYTLSSDAGKHSAALIGEWDTQGLITGADVTSDGKHLVLIGYENKGISSRAFVWGIPNFNGNTIASSKGYQFFLGSPISLGQTEGITFTGTLETKISGESLSLAGSSTPPRMFELDWNGIFTP